MLKPETLLQFRTAQPLELAAGTPPIAAPARAMLPPPRVAKPSDDSIPGQADPYTFDILGLRLGMTAKEAMAAVKARIPSAQITPAMPGTAQFTPKAHFVGGISIHGTNFTVLTNFTESYPFNPEKPEELTSIAYRADAPTDVDRDRFTQAAIAKYGTPTVRSAGRMARWCNRGVLNGPQYLCSTDAPALILESGFQLNLEDPSVLPRERALWSQQQTSAPPL